MEHLITIYHDEQASILVESFLIVLVFFSMFIGFLRIFHNCAGFYIAGWRFVFPILPAGGFYSMALAHTGTLLLVIFEDASYLIYTKNIL